MKFIKVQKISDEKYKVVFVHNFPFHPDYGLGLTEEELLKQGMLVEDIPMPLDNGKIATLFYNPVDDSFFYEYTEKPLSVEEELQQLKEKQALMQQALDELILGGM